MSRNIWQLEGDLQKQYPGKSIKFSFPKECCYLYDIPIENEKMSYIGWFEYNRVKVEVEGEDPFFEEIIPHRSEGSYADFKTHFNNQATGHITDHYLQQVKTLDDETLNALIKNLAEKTLNTEESIKARVDALTALPPDQETEISLQ